MRGFLHGRMPQSIPSLEYKSFINSCYMPRFTTVTTEKQNHKSLTKNAAYAGIPWRMCSTFYLAVVHWHGLRTYRDLTVVSRSYSLKLNSSSDRSHPSRCMRMSMRPPSRTSHYSLTKLEKKLIISTPRSLTRPAKKKKKVRVIEMSCPWLENRESKDFEKTTKCCQLRLELTNRYPEYKVNQ